MPEVRIPLKDTGGRLDPAVIPDVARIPSAIAAGDGMVPVSTASGTWDYLPEAGFGSSGGASLGVTSYSPAAATDHAVAATVPADLEASLLAVAFVAPSSGKVQVDLSAVVRGSTAATRSFWCLRTGTTVVDGSLVMVHEGTAPDRVSTSVLIEGLTPGANYQWKWAAAASAGTTTLTAGGAAVDATSAGPASITVREAPFG